MIAKLIVYAVLLSALAILISSTARIGYAVFSASTGGSIDLTKGVSDEDEERHMHHNEPPILPINQRKLAVKKGEGGPQGISDVLPRLFDLPRRTLDETKLPYKCGAIFIHYNIPGKDGNEIDDWIRGLIDVNEVYYISSAEAGSKEQFIKQINEQIEMNGRFQWIILGSAEHGLSLASDEDVLLRLRENMEELGCQLVSMSIFSEPLDYSMKQTRKIVHTCKNCNIDKITSQLAFGSMNDKDWRGQLDHFLYNDGEIISIDVKLKVRDAISKLRKHFDLVLLDGRNDFAREILTVSGLKLPADEEEVAALGDMEIAGLRYSKELVKQYTKYDAKNGDADFADALNQVYFNDLSFLFNQ